MRNFVVRSLASALFAMATSTVVLAASPNKIVGTWRLVSSTVERQGASIPAYGPTPKGQLIFTADMRYAAILNDPSVPKYASGMRNKGTAEENQAAMAGSLSMYGKYTTDANGDVTGLTVEGASFPNLIGDQRGRDVTALTVDGDRLTESTQRPGGPKLVNVWERIR